MKIGDTITVQSVNSDRPYTGKVLKSARDDPHGTFRMSTDVPWFPERVVPVTALRASGEMLPPRRDQATWQVQGSRGDMYTVTREGEIWSCTCKGFEFRKSCRHINNKMKEIHQYT